MPGRPPTVSSCLEVGGGVERLHGDALGRVPDERVGIAAAQLTRRRAHASLRSIPRRRSCGQVNHARRRRFLSNGRGRARSATRCRSRSSGPRGRHRRGTSGTTWAIEPSLNLPALNTRSHLSHVTYVSRLPCSHVVTTSSRGADIGLPGEVDAVYETRPVASVRVGCVIHVHHILRHLEMFSDSRRSPSHARCSSRHALARPRARRRSATIPAPGTPRRSGCRRSAPPRSCSCATSPTGSRRTPEGVELPVADTAAALGLGPREGSSSPLIRSLNRLRQFELACTDGRA